MVGLTGFNDMWFVTRDLRHDKDMAPLAHGLVVDASPWIVGALPRYVLETRIEIGQLHFETKKAGSSLEINHAPCLCMPHQNIRRDSTLSWSEVRSDQTHCTAGGGDLKGQLGSASLHRQEAQPGMPRGIKNLEWYNGVIELENLNGVIELEDFNGVIEVEDLNGMIEWTT